MALLEGNNPITADGTYTLSVKAGKPLVVGIAGTFGSGTITAQYLVGGTAVAFPDTALTADGGYRVVPPTGNIQFVLSGASSPSINVAVTPEIG